jgi:hypothetical protein
MESVYMKRIFPTGTPPEQIANAVLRMVQHLPSNKPLAVTVELWKKPRTNQQNAYLWGVAYPAILEGGGEALKGWSRDDIHEYMTGEFGGWQVLEGFGRKRMRPVMRSSTMTKQQFSDYLDWLGAKCADMGITIPEPNYEPA